VKPWIERGTSVYRSLAYRLSFLKHPLLLLLRLYFGWTLALTGWKKLANLDATADYLEGLGLFWPKFNAVASGCGELLGGALLMVGLGSRLAALVVVGVMTVAYLTAHPNESRALFTDPATFVSAPPFQYLLTGLLVLFIGPGAVSLDAIVGLFLPRRQGEQAAEGAPPAEPDLTRRQVVWLTATAVAGLAAGVGIRSQLKKKGKEVAESDGSDGDLDAGGKEGDEALAKIDADAPKNVQPSLLVKGEKHVCCGLNTCKGKAKGGGNACAGQGGCATAETHVCQGMNSCKGQGGCGDYPGQNACDGKGSCAVPLKEKQWKIARKRFEELMKLTGRKVGPAPAGCPKKASG
jgi:putative oxidoreductase